MVYHLVAMRLVQFAFLLFLCSLCHVNAQITSQCTVNVSSALSSISALSASVSSNAGNIATNTINLQTLAGDLGVSFFPASPSSPYLDNNTILIGESTCWNRNDFTFSVWNTNHGAFQYVNPTRNWCIGGQGMASAKTWPTSAPFGTAQFPNLIASGSSAWSMYTSLSFMHLLNQTGNFIVMYGINDDAGWTANGLGTWIYTRAYGAAYNLFANWDGRVAPTNSVNINSFPDTPILGSNVPSVVFNTNGQSRICIIYADAGPFVNFNVALANGTTILVTRNFTAQGNPSYAVNYVWVPPTTSITVTGVSGNAVLMAVVQEVQVKRKVLFVTPSTWSGSISGNTVNPPVASAHNLVLNAVQTLGLNYLDFSSFVVDTYDNTHPGPLTNAAILKFMYSLNQTQVSPSFFLQ